MSINIKNAKKEFKEYVKQYNPEDAQINLKIGHIERVTQNSKRIAQNLNLSQEDIELAELIGLLHDIGRFEQVRIYHTFTDQDSINHGEYGVKVLFEDNLIRKFIQQNNYDDIIKLAILNHNKSDIESGLTEKQYLHAQIIRDADKTDIYNILIAGDIKAIYGKEDISNEKISDEVFREFIEDKRIDYTKRKSGADILVSHFNYVYDLNFKETKQVIKENKYIDKLYERFTFKDKKTMERYKEVYRLAKQQIENE